MLQTPHWWTDSKHFVRPPEDSRPDTDTWPDRFPRCCRLSCGRRRWRNKTLQWAHPDRTEAFRMSPAQPAPSYLKSLSYYTPEIWYCRPHGRRTGCRRCSESDGRRTSSHRPPGPLAPPSHSCQASHWALPWSDSLPDTTR